METIHLKTVDPVSQALLQSAATKGLDLNWERYEKLQPQDGFLRTGLSCPYGCLQGPCRIDPFGRGAALGICGLDRDRMVAALLLRLCLNGVLETLGGLAGEHIHRVPAWPGSLAARAARALEKLGGGELALNEVYQSAARLHRPGDTAEDLIRCCLRLAVLTLALMDTPETAQPQKDKLSCRVGYGLLSSDNPIIGVYGQPSMAVLTGLVEAAAEGEPGVELVSLGNWIALKSGYLPIACTSGEAELLLSSGRISLLVCESGTDPSVPALCKKMEIPVIFTHEASEPSKILRLAVESHNSHAKTDFFQDLPPAEEAEIIMNANVLESQFKEAGETRWAFMGGTDSLQQSLGWIATEVAPALAGDGIQIAGWGDAALWLVKRGLTRDHNEHPIRLLGPQRGPLEALKAITALDVFDRLKGICFTGLDSCRDLTVALGLAMMGAGVCIGTPLPLWGSKKVCDWLAAFCEGCGGEFSHFDHPAGASEILQWFSGQ